MSAIRIVHLTDPHLTTPDPTEGIRGKRRLGYLSWIRRRRFIHQADVLEQVCAAVQAENATQIVITGDLMQLGLPGEIDAALAWLGRLAPPEQISLVLGNHDLYARDSWQNLRSCWHPYLGFTSGGSDVYPLVRDLSCGNQILRIVKLNSACVSAPFMASGSLGAAQCSRLRAQMSGKETFHCVLLHHPPIAGTVSWRKSLLDARQLTDSVPVSAAGLVLHGHTHRNSYDGNLGRMPVFGTASASSSEAGRMASYRVFDVHRANEEWLVDMTLKELGRDRRLRVRARTAWNASGQVTSCEVPA